MRAYIIRRLLISIPLVFLMTFVVFAVINTDPQTALDRYILNPNISFQIIEQVKEQTGFYDAMPVRYVKWLGGVLGDIRLGRRRRPLVSFADPRQFRDQFAVESLEAPYKIVRPEKRRPFLALALPGPGSTLTLGLPGSPHITHRLRRTDWAPRGKPIGRDAEDRVIFSTESFRSLAIEAGNPGKQAMSFVLRIGSGPEDEPHTVTRHFVLGPGERAGRNFRLDCLASDGLDLERVRSIGFGLADEKSIERSNPAELQVYRVELELDEPWLTAGGRPDFGRSHDNIPVIEKLAGRIRNTILLVIGAMLITWVVALPAGVIASTHQYGSVDKSLGFMTFVGMAMPSFFLAVLVRVLIQEINNPESILSFLPSLPDSGRTSIHYESMTSWQQTVDLARHAIAPTLVLALGGMAGMQRVMRATMLETLRQPFIVTARAKGLSERAVVYKHALRNAITPFVAGFGSILPGLIGGSLFIELVFNYPGVGQMMYPAVLNRDLNLVMANTLIASLLLVLGNLIADILLAIVDPRVSYA